MNEYETLGHMKHINESSSDQDSFYYFPHHAVIKTSSTTTKTRVVFEGSAKTTTGVSLNDAQKIGPIVQNELFTILLGFRRHAYVLTADIEKNVSTNLRFSRRSKVLAYFLEISQLTVFKML